MPPTTDLDLLASAPPRPDAPLRRLVRRASPVLGFVVYGILYAVAVVNTAVLVTILGLVALLGTWFDPPWPMWIQALVLTAVGVVFVASWLPFRAWVRRRRAAIVELLRAGELRPARVLEVRRMRVRSAPVTYATIELVGEGVSPRFAVSFAGYSDEFVEGSTQPVLHHPTTGFALAFPLAGRAVVARRK